MAENGLRYNYREQNSTEEFDAHIAHKCSWRVTRFVFTMVLLVLVMGASLAGSVLIHFMLDKLHIEGLCEWENQLVQVLTIAIPLGIVVGVLSFDVRAGIVVSILTIASLFIGWDSYLPSNPAAESGVFDFLLGCKTNVSGRDGGIEEGIRQLAGMSLWGLTLTFPAGYILYSLDFGSTYAVSGSLIGSTFFFAENSEIDLGALSCVGDGCSYYIWGFWIWLVLLIVSINRLCKSIRHVRTRTKQPVLLRCYHACCYSKPYTAIFEILAFLFTVLLLMALVFFSLVDQSSDTKGQSVCGLLVNILGLVGTQSYRTGKCVQDWLQKRRLRQRQYRVPPPMTNSVRVPQQTSTTDATPPTYHQVMVGTQDLYPQIGEELNTPPEAATPVPSVSEQQIIANEHSVEGFANERTNLFRGVQQRQQQQERKPLLHGCYTCVDFFQKFFYMELLRVVQLLIDLMAGFVTCGVFGLTVTAVVLGWGNPRFVDM